MKFNRKDVMLFWIAVVGGICSGISWFWIGEGLDGILGNFMSWYILPGIIPLMISLFIYILGVKKQDKSKVVLVRSLCFLGLYYFCHWLPMFMVIIFCCFKGGF
ncbi:MAG: hypothetical protein ISS71_06890 [Phycisphaerae bacterium]|nr:hypothetical protein [Phycisphaerae bacterium]